MTVVLTPSESRFTYFNREVSLLRFHRRVLAEAASEKNPLLERLRFLAISSNNLDEYFETRVAGLVQQQRYAHEAGRVLNTHYSEPLGKILRQAQSMVSAQYKLLNNVLVPELSRQGVHSLRRQCWSKKLLSWAEKYFIEQVAPVLSPIALDPAHPFPKLHNKSLNYIVRLSGRDAFGRENNIAVVRIPRSLPRVLLVPKEYRRSKKEEELVLLSSVIRANIEELFVGMKVEGAWPFRITRNSDLWVDEEDVEDLKSALNDELFQRHFGDAVRLEIDHSCPANIEGFLQEQFSIPEGCTFRVDGPVNLNRLMQLPTLVSRPDLKFVSHIPSKLEIFQKHSSMFDAIASRDIVAHHPYDSFGHTTDFVAEAADDPNVLAIKMTLYRTGEDSRIVDSLKRASKNGKEVTVIVELKARFDEAANIDVANELQLAGANVSYGLVGHKTHAKMIFVVRRESGSLKRYVHVGTGNYHYQTARIYTDIGLFTANEEIASDIQMLFTALTGQQSIPLLNRVWMAPLNLHANLIQAIRREAEAAQKGEKGRILLKMNSLIEKELIAELYLASNVGVKIDCIVRGMCALVPGVANQSENIRVHSIVGRFLEHARAFYFHAGGQKDLWISSADWMGRNMFRRFELGIPIEDNSLKEKLVRECFHHALKDNQQRWELGTKGKYLRVDEQNETPFSLHTCLMRTGLR